MDKFVSSNEGDLSPKAQASGSRSRQRQAQLDNSSSSTEGATAANKRRKPRRVSKLSLPGKPRETDANGLLEKSSNSRGSSSLRERLAERPASGRQLGNDLPWRTNNAENETPLSEATRTAAKVPAPVPATAASAGKGTLTGSAVAASMFDGREQGNSERDGAAAVGARSSQEGRRSAPIVSPGGADGRDSKKRRRVAVHPTASTARVPIPPSQQMTDFFPRSEVAPNVVRAPSNEHRRADRRVRGNICAGGDSTECDDNCLSCGRTRRYSDAAKEEEEEEIQLRKRGHRRLSSHPSSRAPETPDQVVAPLAPPSSTPVNDGPEVAHAVGSTAGTAVAAGSRAATAERAAAAAERRAVMAEALVGAAAGEGRAARAKEPIAVSVTEAAAAPATEGVQEAVGADYATASVQSTAAESVAEAVVTARETETLEAPEPAAEDASAAPPACFRRRGMAALWLKNRARTGGCSGAAGVDDAGQAAFQRRALSSVFRKGLKEMRLRLGRVSGSRTGAGVVRGVPEGGGGPSREGTGVSCLAFDSMGALLAAGGTESVTVYDFDEYVPQIPHVKAYVQSGVRAYLQPSHCIQTRRAVSCVRWNPANENQLAVSFLHYSEIQVFDLEDILPGADATPVLTLSPGGGTPGPGSRARGNGFVGMGRIGSLSRSGSGGGVGTSRGSGGQRGLGQLSLEFVLRGATTGRRVSHLVAGGRGGMFRVWRLGPTSTGHLTPYLQVQLSANSRLGALSSSRLAVRPDVTAVCCISQDVAIIGTDTGSLATYSLHPPEVKAFQSGKSADRLAHWCLSDPKVWGGRGLLPGSGGGGGSGEAFRILWVRPSPDHAPGVVVCGLRSGRVVVFDTRSGGRALGITKPGVSPSMGYCEAGPGGGWGQAILSCSRVDVQLLATSARAALDTRRADGGGRDSGLRPGPGWALGGAGGGGFRVEASDGYDLCLPMEVTRVIPGKSGVVLSRDARSYLCSRAQVGLLNSRMVTSSIVIGGEEHSVEAMGHDGTTLVLDRRYRGPQVGGARLRGGTPASLPPAAAAVSAGDDAGDDALTAVGGDDAIDEPTGAEESGGRATPESTASQGGFGSKVSVDRGLANGDDAGVSARGVNLASASGDGAQGTGDRKEGDVPQMEVIGGQNGQDRSGAVGEHNESEESTPASKPQQGWDRTWRPNDGVRVFAKLRAVFDDDDDGGGGADLKTSRLSGVTDAWGSSSASSSLGVRGEEGAGGVQAVPSWASLQVVARAGLDVSATAITCHPRMNFVLLGSSDGTIVAALPGGKKRKRTFAW